MKKMRGREHATPTQLIKIAIFRLSLHCHAHCVTATILQYQWLRTLAHDLITQNSCKKEDSVLRNKEVVYHKYQ